MLFEEQPVPETYELRLELQSYHKTTATEFTDGGIAPEGLCKVFTDSGGVLHEPLLLYHVEHGKCCRAGKVVASECGAEHTVLRLDVRGDEYAPNRETVAHTLGCGDYVGTHARVLVGEKPTAAYVT